MENENKKLPKIDENTFALSGDKFFFTIQGEGFSIGKPAVFMRLHLCNLSCSWCDTPYTWNEKLPEYFSEWSISSVEDAKNEICKFSCQRLVITGGEPLLQQKAILNLAKLLPEWAIEIETNGTIEPLMELRNLCAFNVSPKLQNSNLSPEKRIRSNAIKQFKDLTNVTFKFVVQNKNDLNEVKELTSSYGIPNEKVIIMPEGRSTDEINKGLANLVEECKLLNFRLLPRLQTYIWGNQRAV